MNTNSGGLEGRVVVVTGASSGVGYATARRLALQEGATVVAVGRRRMFRIEALSKQITAQPGGGQMLAVTADMAAPGQAQALAAQVLAQYGRIDGFVHAVNRALRLTALEVSDQEFDLTMMVNVKSALYGVQSLVPLMREQGRGGGVVIYNPTPTPTTTFAASEAVYAAAANALSGLASGWGRQLEAHGVRVREVAPMPLGDQAPGDVCAHDDLVLDALRETLSPAPPAPRLTVADSARLWAGDADRRRRDDAYLRPVVLSARGGLSLTQFSEQ